MFHYVDIALKERNAEMGMQTMRLAYGDYSREAPLVGHVRLRFEEDYEVVLETVQGSVECVVAIGKTSRRLSAEKFRHLLSELLISD